MTFPIPTCSASRFPRLRAAACAAVLIASPPVLADGLPRLAVSENKRFLVRDDGSPFFYLADTAWELFHRLGPADAARYLEDRARKGYTVVQAVALAELDGHTDPNAQGNLPLVDLDPARPAVADGPNNDYWDHVDFIIDKANDLGIYVGFLPTWGRYWHDKVKDEKPIFTRQNAETYGLWLGERYRQKGVIWILGGDRAVENDEHKEIIRAMARGLRRGDGGTHLMTFHPPGGSGSSKWFHEDDWLDFNMRQNGHVIEFTERYSQTRADYDRTPIKPVIDGEPIYEDHPVSFNAKALGHSIAADVRRPLYWDLFTGACGHTYGHHSVWQMWSPGKKPINNPLLPWSEAIDQPGAAQMQHARKLLESRPILTRIPDDSVLVDDVVQTSVPGAGTRRFAATRDASGSFAMVYVPVGRRFQVNLDKVSATTVKAWWFDPRNGQATPIGEFPGSGRREFVTPNPGEDIDWVLVLDDASKGYPPPGAAPGKSAGNWPGFRGPGGQGHSNEAELPLEWNEKKNVAWVTAIPGEGWSSPIVWDDHVFVTTAAGGGKSCRVLAIDRRGGGILWDKEVFQQEPGHKQDKNSHATPTPATDGERVYTLFGDGSFAALSFDGAVVWTHREVQFYGEHGLGASPLLHGDLLIMPFDGSSPGPDTKVGWQTPWDQSFILALDKRTGKERWRGKRGLSRIAHVSPVIVRAGGRDELLSCAGDAIQGFDPATGERLWHIFSEGEGVVPTPAFGGGLVFTASGFGSPAIRAVRPGGRGDVTGTHIAWEQRRGVPKISSLLYVEPHLYSVGDNGVVFCYRGDSGEVVWQERAGGAFSPSPVFAAGRIYLLDEKADTTVIAPGPKFEVLAKNTLEGRCQASMAVSQGMIFIRTERQLWCVSGGRR